MMIDQRVIAARSVAVAAEKVAAFRAAFDEADARRSWTKDQRRLLEEARADLHDQEAQLREMRRQLLALYDQEVS